METQRLSVMLGIVFLLAAVAWADRVTSDYDHSVNFSNYKTFMWIRGPESKEAFMKERIMEAVNAQLTARGMRQVNDGADLAVGASIVTEEKHTWETYYGGTGPGEPTARLVTYEGATLTVDLFDAESRKLIWQAVGTNEVSPKPQSRTRETDKVIKRMFKYFPGH